MESTRRSVLITGASSGIGRATALRLERNGWRVFAAVRKASDAEASAGGSSGAIEAIQLDVTDRESITGAAREVTARLGGRGLDGLFNNAGIGSISPVEYTSLDKLREVFEVNLFGQIATIQAFLPLIRAARGRIINTGSVGDHLTPPFGGPLSSPKAAFASMSAALRLELRSQGIAVCGSNPVPSTRRLWRRPWAEWRTSSPLCRPRGRLCTRRRCGAWRGPSQGTSTPEALPKSWRKWWSAR